MLLKIIRKFSSAHHLPQYDGPCRNLHGHTWKVVFLLEGPVKENGMVYDFKILKKLLDEQLPDHQYLNDFVENPTAENLAVYLFNKVSAALKTLGLTLKTLELWENENAAAVVESK
jgi:6-pyruvoyltetrahydropterin/6-carboxytetrahydropterin synthase